MNKTALMLAADNNLARFTLEQVADALYWIDADARFVDVNPAACRMLGYTRAELLTMTVFDIDTTLSAERWYAAWQQVKQTGTLTLESAQRTNDGRIIPVELVANFITFGGYELQCTFVRDITERKRVEAELRTSEARYRALVESQIDLISRYLPDTTLTFVNDAYCKFYGKTHTELVGQSFLTMVAPEFHAQALQETAHFLQDPRPIGGEYLNYRWDGRECWIYWILQGITDETGQVVEIQATGRDTTQLKQAEQALRAKEQAEAASRAKSAFLATMSHELRSPLNAILGFSDLMQREARAGRQPLTAEQQQHLARIHRSGEHLLTLINNVLDLSKIEAGRVVVTPTNINLAVLLDDVMQMFSLMAANKGLELQLVCDPWLPPFIQTDAVKLRQVLINLLSNAVKFTTTGGITLGVAPLPTTDATPGINQLQFEVVDTGSGIAPADMPHLFEVFSRISTEQSRAGAGLGLAISHQFVQLLGGELTVESRVGQGSHFRFTIPVQVVAAAEINERSSTRSITGLAPDQPGYRILIADDDENNRQLLCRLLQPLGFDIREAGNGREAITVWQAWQPQLIVMDLRMPLLDGIEATRRIKATPEGQATCVIALTASVFAEERSQILAAGCDDFLRKPLREAELLALFEQHLGVRFCYEETAEAVASPLPAQLAMADLATGMARLPMALLVQLESAAMRANMNRVHELIAALQSYDASIARMLSELADTFEYPRIVQLIQTVRQAPGASHGEHAAG